MKTLYLLRHAHTESAAPGQDDHDRILSPRGLEEARNVGLYMKEQGLVPDAMLCSSSVRTTETAKLVFEVLFDGGKVPVASSIDRDYYLATPRTLFDGVTQADDRFESLIVIGHNPGMGDLAATLAGAGGQDIGGFPPAALAAFTCETGTWENFSLDAAKLKALFMP